MNVILFKARYLVLLLLFVGCGVNLGVYHTVGEGETLWRIARTYDVDLKKLTDSNNIKDPFFIRVGQKIFIPYAKRVRKVERIAYRGDDRLKENRRELVLEKGRFAWPVKGEVISPFGVKEGKAHNGIDISSANKVSIMAAANGMAVYSGGDISGYGNMIILKHEENYFTIYAHNSKNLIKEGEKVKLGDVVAFMGRSGSSSKYYLHFEIRNGRRPRDPLFFLP
jgi:lipoprotein NlpD